VPLACAGIFNCFHAPIFRIKNLSPVLTIDHKSNRAPRSKLLSSIDAVDRFDMTGTNYRNIANTISPGWALRATLDEPRAEGLQASILRKHMEYDSYLEIITGLFLVWPFSI
jgi:hypothetical protein